MEPPRRIDLQTVPQSPSRKKEKKVRPTLRFNLTIGESTLESCPEISYTDLVRKAMGPVENGEEEAFAAQDAAAEDKLAATARMFEKKYGQHTASGKRGKTRKHGRWEDDLDLGMGYDDTDPFIDNDEAYDELVPSTMTTQYGGFYINSGELEFRDISDSDNDTSDFKLMKKRKMVKSRVLRSSDDDEPPSTDSGTMPKRKFKKKMTNGIDSVRRKDGDNVYKSTKKSKSAFIGSTMKRKTVADLLKQKAIHQANATSQSKMNQHQQDQIADAINSVVMASVQTVSGETAVVAQDSDSQEQLGHGSMVDDVDRDTGGSGSHSPNVGGAPHKPADGGGGASPKLPDELPKQLVDYINMIKQAAKVSEEGKRKFFMPEVNNMLLEIERLSKQQLVGKRSLIYTHLAAHLPCGKETLLKRAKKLLLDELEDAMKAPILKLKQAIAAAMTAQVAEYKKLCEAVGTTAKDGENITESADDDNSMKSEEKAKRMPRRVFKWTDRIRSLLNEVVVLRLRIYDTAKIRSYTSEDYVKQFLETSLKPMWPVRWMNVRILFRESRGAHSDVTMSFPKQATLSRKVVSPLAASSPPIDTPPLTATQPAFTEPLTTTTHSTAITARVQTATDSPSTAAPPAHVGAPSTGDGAATKSHKRPESHKPAKQRDDNAGCADEEQEMGAPSGDDLDLMITPYALTSLPDDAFVSDILSASSGLFERLPSPQHPSASVAAATTSSQPGVATSAAAAATTVAAATRLVSVGDLVASVTEQALGSKPDKPLWMSPPRNADASEPAAKKASPPPSSSRQQTDSVVGEAQPKAEATSVSVASWRKTAGEVDANNQSTGTGMVPLVPELVSWRQASATTVSSSSSKQAKDVSTSDEAHLTDTLNLFSRTQSLLASLQQHGSAATEREPGEVEDVYTGRSIHVSPQRPPGGSTVSPQRPSSGNTVSPQRPPGGSSLSPQRPPGGSTLIPQRPPGGSIVSPQGPASSSTVSPPRQLATQAMSSLLRGGSKAAASSQPWQSAHRSLSGEKSSLLQSAASAPSPNHPARQPSPQPPTVVDAEEEQRLLLQALAEHRLQQASRGEVRSMPGSKVDGKSQQASRGEGRSSQVSKVEGRSAQPVSVRGEGRSTQHGGVSRVEGRSAQHASSSHTGAAASLQASRAGERPGAHAAGVRGEGRLSQHASGSSSRGEQNVTQSGKLERERHKSPARADQQKSPHGSFPLSSSPHKTSPHSTKSERESPSTARSSERKKSSAAGSSPVSHHISTPHSSPSAYISQSIYSMHDSASRAQSSLFRPFPPVMMPDFTTYSAMDAFSAAQLTQAQLLSQVSLNNALYLGAARDGSTGTSYPSLNIPSTSQTTYSQAAPSVFKSAQSSQGSSTPSSSQAGSTSPLFTRPGFSSK
ncbi:PREDICTED: ubinuclein-1-like isoform X2 [Priapulus caudatus]|uniref:Ubinuclein-1-like isoform X2 n=1 Tax=Priapulus caudatus TaxID=37621 RepID=A0ABM1EUJ3_PRICU|nr:PREDICTED: ubinuclein-1-like isoform X2 [Priapulus caudatus]